MLRKIKKKTKILVAFFILLIGILLVYFFSHIALKEYNGIWKENISIATNIKEKTKVEHANEIESIETKNKKKQKEKESEEIKEKIGNSTNTWKIKIPTLNLEAPIAEGTSQEVLAETVGHFEESKLWEGNVALAAHNRGYECNFFQKIKNLKEGDIIIYQTQKGKRKYKVVLNKVIKETNWSYIENTKDNRITLITCEENKREYRRCIQGIEIKDGKGD